MTKEDRNVMAILALAFGQMTSHLISIDKELGNQNPNFEQIEAHWIDMMNTRNDIARLLCTMSKDIDHGIKQIKQLQKKDKR